MYLTPYDDEFNRAMELTEEAFAVEREAIARETHLFALRRELDVRQYQQWLAQGAIDLAARDEEIAASQADLVREYPEATAWLENFNQQIAETRKETWND